MINILSKIDILLLFFGIIFPIGALLGEIEFKAASIVFILHTGTFLFAILAKVRSSRIHSGLAYFFFGIGFAALKMYADGEVFPVYEYLLVGLVVAIVPFIFRFKTVAITGGMLSYWLTFIYTILSSWDSYGSDDFFTSVLDLFLFGLGENLPFATFAFSFLIFGFISLAACCDNRKKRKVSSRPQPNVSAGAYHFNNANDFQEYHSSGKTEDTHKVNRTHSDDEEEEYYYSSYSKDDEFETSESSVNNYSNTFDEKEEEETNHYGWSQSSIDLENEKEYYGTPSWYEEKQIEEKDFGLPWYARDKDDGFGRPAWARDDEED